MQRTLQGKRAIFCPKLRISKAENLSWGLDPIVIQEERISNLSGYERRKPRLCKNQTRTAVPYDYNKTEVGHLVVERSTVQSVPV